MRCHCCKRRRDCSSAVCVFWLLPVSFGLNKTVLYTQGKPGYKGEKVWILLRTLSIFVKAKGSHACGTSATIGRKKVKNDVFQMHGAMEGSVYSQTTLEIS